VAMTRRASADPVSYAMPSSWHYSHTSPSASIPSSLGQVGAPVLSNRKPELFPTNPRSQPSPHARAQSAAVPLLAQAHFVTLSAAQGSRCSIIAAAALAPGAAPPEPAGFRLDNADLEEGLGLGLLAELSGAPPVLHPAATRPPSDRANRGYTWCAALLPCLPCPVCSPGLKRYWQQAAGCTCSDARRVLVPNGVLPRVQAGPPHPLQPIPDPAGRGRLVCGAQHGPADSGACHGVAPAWHPLGP
jgi:hypothetical protein